MASVRTITINGVPYLQVVGYSKTKDSKPKIDVIKSFGRDSLESRMKAEQFVASYNKLQDLAKEMKNKPKSDLLSAALAIFGIVLGAAIVVALLKNRSDD